MESYGLLQEGGLDTMISAYHTLQNAVSASLAAVMADGGKNIQSAANALQQTSKAAKTAFGDDFDMLPGGANYCGPAEITLATGLSTFVNTSAQLVAAANALAALFHK